MAQQQEPSYFTCITHQADELQRRQIRLWLIVVLSLWTFAAITALIVTFCITQSPLSLSLFSTLAPPAYLWHRVAKFALMDKRMYELEKMKIMSKR